jgi:tetratricopeptide (TPR) repeat protein
MLPLVGAAAPARTRIFILPFTLLEPGSSSSDLAADLHRILQEALDRDPRIEMVSDPENTITAETFTDADLLSEGTSNHVTWVIAGEFQGDANDWELFLRVLDPDENIPRRSSLQGDNTHGLEQAVQDWVENNRDFLVATDPALRAQHEKELSHQEALKLYQQALQLKAQDPETLNQKIPILKKVIEIEPDFSSAYLSLGLAYQLQKNYPEAMKQYQKAIELQPDFYTAYYNMGTLYQAMNDLKTAIEAYRKALELHPDYREAWYNLGVALEHNTEGEEFGKGFDAEGAKAAFLKAIEVDPNSLDSYVALGVCYQHTGEYRRSKEIYEEAIRRNDKYELAWYNLALLLDSFLNDYPEAIRTYQKYISLGGQRSQGARNRIRYLQNLISAGDTTKSSNNEGAVSP